MLTLHSLTFGSHFLHCNRVYPLQSSSTMLMLFSLFLSLLLFTYTLDFLGQFSNCLTFIQRVPSCLYFFCSLLWNITFKCPWIHLLLINLLNCLPEKSSSFSARKSFGSCSQILFSRSRYFSSHWLLLLQLSLLSMALFALVSFPFLDVGPPTWIIFLCQLTGAPPWVFKVSRL